MGRATPLPDEVEEYWKARSLLSETFGREPSVEELSVELNWTLDQVDAVSNYSIEKQDEEDFEVRFRMTAKNHEMEKCRAKLGLMQDDVAKMTGLTSHKISTIETMRHFPTPDEQEKIAKCLQTTTEKIFPEWIEVFCERWKRQQKEKIVKMNYLQLGSPEVLQIESENKSPVEVAEHSFKQEVIQEILKDLTPREREVLISRFGFNGEYPKTLEEVGRHFDVRQERVRQIEAKALEKIRYHRLLHKLR